METSHDCTENMTSLLMKVSPLLTTSDRVRFVDSRCLKRYLRARKGDVLKAHDAVHETLLWRETEKHHQIRSSHSIIESQMATGKNYTRGFDRFGNPVMYMRLSRDTDSSECPDKLKFMLFNIERALRLQQADADGVVWVVDCSGFSVSWMAPARMKLALDLASAMQKHYPERLATLFLTNVPWLFRYDESV
eukprot:TRINITY_DN6340_c0_g1_i4.p1 TRINITY_DN6340_c0_g1~~TRINITY_DN6340_c0_g1_i4.p1  ORF type:complete len:218 (+),score=16.48 TRINITY_DN6340_c0_g1_i4:81-656(+)